MSDAVVLNASNGSISSEVEEKELQDVQEERRSSDKLTVFADPDNFNIKHPLQNRWTMWYDNPGKKATQQSWHEHLKQILTFDTVEDFWRLFNNVVPASRLMSGSNYHLFKENVEPKWEDPVNEHGGKWIINLPTKNRGQLDKLWLWTLLACVGENLGDEGDVCGVVVSIRKQQDKIALWTKSSTNEELVVGIGKKWKQILELPENVIIGFQSHQDSMRRNSSYNNKNRYEC
eukprot:TRINITY_DN2065_c0_g1_i1.p1 TRINITY_DN2065_c0_g1~~TRINITY_DN2065_c0_g1_i1.p1  ORF type:complete len:232 (-),score=42.46 TRINITY_DN2065_c0_g1_i1:316-1011(-)